MPADGRNSGAPSAAAPPPNVSSPRMRLIVPSSDLLTSPTLQHHASSISSPIQSTDSIRAPTLAGFRRRPTLRTRVTDEHKNFNATLNRMQPHRAHLHGPQNERSKLPLRARGRLRYYWDLFILVLLVYVATVSVFVFSFFGTLGISSIFFWVERSLDLFFLTDILLNFVTAVEPEDYTLRHTITRYLRTTFVFDLVATIPWDLIAPQGSSDQPSLINFPRFLRLLRLTKITRLARVFSLSQTVSRFEVRSRLKYGHVRLVTLALTVALVSHWFACMFYFFGSVRSSTENSIFEAWTEDVTKVPQDLFGRYIIALYFSVYTITTIGYGDVVPGTTLERVYVTIFMLFGAACFAFVISQVSETAKDLNDDSVDHRRTMDSITAFTHNRKLKNDLAVRVRLYFQHEHHIRVQRLDAEKELLGRMSPDLRREVLTNIYGEMMKNTGLFEGVTEGDMLQIYESALLERFVRKNDVLFRRGEDADKAFIVRSGEITVHHDGGHETSYFNEDMIDVGAMVVNRRRGQTAIAKRDVSVVCLDRNAVMRLLSTPKYEQHFRSLREMEGRKLLQDIVGRVEWRLRLQRMARDLRTEAEALLRSQGKLVDVEQTSRAGMVSQGDARSLDIDLEEVKSASAAESPKAEPTVVARVEMDPRDEKIRNQERLLGQMYTQLRTMMRTLDGLGVTEA